MIVFKKLSRLLLVAMCALVLSMGTMWAQNLKVTGRVTDKKGEPIVAAYVVVKGTQLGVATDINGVYKVEAPAKGTLEFSSMGYKTVLVPVNNRSKIDVTLSDDALMLEDAVVVGFGTQRKENLTGAVASINTQKTLESRPIADIGRGLQGATPGLNVRIGSAEVGSDPIIRIRGQIGSYKGGSSPLILLDNVEIPSIQMINPDDIESISVLKDAASASIYGSKAAFGVILISSKKGAKTESVKVTYSTNISFQSMAKKYDIAGVDGLHYTVEAAERLGTKTPVGAFWLIDRAGYNAAVAWDQKYGSTLDPNSPMTYGRDWYVDGSNRKIGVRTYDPYDYLVKEWAPTQNHNISVAGNTGKTTFNISLGYLDQTGMMKTTNYDDYKRWNANIRLNTKVNDFIDVHAGLMYSKTQKRWAYATSSTTADIWYYMYRWGPTFPLVPVDEYGNNVRTTAYETATANAASDISSYSSINIGTTITPLENWDINVDYTYASNETSSWRPGTSFYGGNTWGAAVAVKDDSGNAVNIDNMWNEYNQLGSQIPAKMLNVYRYTSAGTNPDHVYRDAYVSQRSTYNITSNYEFKIADAHTFKTMLGMNAVSYEQTGNWSQKTTLLDYTNPQFSLATGTQTSGGGHTWNSQLGFFGRLNYDYNNKYLLEANIRYDGSSKFPTALQWRWFPSFSAGWRVTEEPWMAGVSNVLSSLKLRASWGTIGDQSVSNSLYIPTMTFSNSGWIHNGAIDNYFTTPAAVASDITWQDISTLDFGVEARLFNAIGVTFDWYRRNTENMIVGAEGIGYGFGAAAPNGNYGSLRTNGWELSLDYGHVFDNGFSISATASIADALTTITEYGTGTIITSWYNGKTYGEIWGYQVDRLYQNDDFQRDGTGTLIKGKSSDGYTVYLLTDENAPTQGKLQSGSLLYGPGDVKFKDQNGDGVINNGQNNLADHGDLVVIGNTTPRYEYSFRVDMDYKGFDLSIFFQGIGKRDLWGSSPLTVAGFNSSDGCMAQAIAGDFWYETVVDGQVVDSNYDAFYPRAANLGSSATGFNMQYSDKYLLNMAYLRLKNVTFGYTLPEKATKKAFIDKLRIYVSLENFLTFDHLNGIPIDPEEIAGYSVYNSSNYNSSRTGVGAPAFKSASVGLQLTF
ncbi:MAG: SusC/RagA family TonB-linked outer membrane protein [Bacteroidales bacterium]|nr:SusC/RagA family TonB-linked outer membrane protein [Bacteroidales bacterium]